MENAVGSFWDPLVWDMARLTMLFTAIFPEESERPLTAEI